MTAFSIKLSSEANKLVHFVSKRKKDEKCSLLGVSNLWQKNQRNDNLQVRLPSLLSLIWGTDIRRKLSFGPAMMPWCLMMVVDSEPGPRVTAPARLKNSNSDSREGIEYRDLFYLLLLLSPLKLIAAQFLCKPLFLNITLVLIWKRKKWNIVLGSEWMEAND